MNAKFNYLLLILLACSAMPAFALFKHTESKRPGVRKTAQTTSTIPDLFISLDNATGDDKISINSVPNESGDTITTTIMYDSIPLATIPFMWDYTAWKQWMPSCTQAPTSPLNFCSDQYIQVNFNSGTNVTIKVTSLVPKLQYTLNDNSGLVENFSLSSPGKYIENNQFYNTVSVNAVDQEGTTTTWATLNFIFTPEINGWEFNDLSANCTSLININFCDYIQINTNNNTADITINNMTDSSAAIKAKLKRR